MSMMEFTPTAPVEQSYEGFENGGEIACGESETASPFATAFSVDDLRDLFEAQTRLAAAWWSVATLPLRLYSARSANGTGPI